MKSEEIKEKMWHCVYVYTTDIKEQHGRYKIGKADRKARTIEDAVWIRIKEQQTAASGDETFNLIRVFNADDVNMRSIDLESALHNILKDYKIIGKTGGKRKKKSEVFETKTLGPIDAAYNKIKTGVYRPNNYILRKEQEDAVNKAFDYYNNKGNVFLFNAIMRFGKTFSAYSLMKKINAKKVLVLTHKPAIGDCWETDLLDEVKFEGYEFFNAIDFSKSNPIDLLNKEQFVLFSSFQDILGKNLDGNIKDKWEIAINTDFDLVIIDEVHFGFPSEKSQNFLKSLKYKYRLDLSGTPINLLSSGYYEEDQIYTWSYIDEQEMKKKNINDEVYKWLPSINLYTYKISDEIINYIDEFEEEEKSTLNKFFAADDNYKFVNEASVQKFLDNLATPEPRFLRSPFNDDQVSKYLKHMFWYMRSVNSVKAMALMLREHTFFKKYKVIVTAGDNEGENPDSLELVRKAIYQVNNSIGECKDYVGTITISCGKLNTGVTVPEWNSVFFLNECESVQTYWQTAFRCKSPNKNENKTEAYIFDFNPNRALNMMYNFAEENGKSGTSNILVIRKLLDTMRILAYDGNSLIPNNVEDWLNEIIKIGADANRTIARFNKDWLFNKHCEINNKIIEILNNVEASGKKKIDPLEISSDEYGKGKTYKTTIERDKREGKQKKTTMMEIINRARTVTSVLPNFLIISEDQEKWVEDIYKTKQKEMFESVCGIDVEDFKMLVESGLINNYKINKAIESFHLAEQLELKN